MFVTPFSLRPGAPRLNMRLWGGISSPAYRAIRRTTVTFWSTTLTMVSRNSSWADLAHLPTPFTATRTTLTPFLPSLRAARSSSWSSHHRGASYLDFNFLGSISGTKICTPPAFLREPLAGEARFTRARPSTCRATFFTR